MITKQWMEIDNHRKIADHIWELTLKGTLVEQIERPGQFIHIKVDSSSDLLLRRPISISSFDKQEGWMKLIYRAQGEGTKRLSQKHVGDKVDVLGPLGNGFEIEKVEDHETVMIVGGGIGVPPLYELSRQFKMQNKKVTHVLGFQSRDVSFYQEEFSQLGLTFVTTVDGTEGTKGFVTDVMRKNIKDSDVIFTCGPTPMLHAIEETFSNHKRFISLEERMGCGIGTCLACVCKVNSDSSDTAYKKVCSDGPVFRGGEVIYG
ncbi:dihydroorotate dehydrogenase electron transfer subunit [Bacillus carboniphilus]|uniref:Dihydroorotate dehydrogenase B (NAD(+)), electron transfer subunit n=1 Tax=Bacillus carboniphilus TaxID=86663 RepID=A0ABY9JW23_9BACI|nr:dihydroorotate dehydrogenase electron transfer subunit [Bacillus carboniphilus]WLR43599.1 dihydroorotate dehydrogenase electron transfer subunit [Bacillus carboniphilus]